MPNFAKPANNLFKVLSWNWEINENEFPFFKIKSLGWVVWLTSNFIKWALLPVSCSARLIHHNIRPGDTSMATSTALPHITTFLNIEPIVCRSPAVSNILITPISYAVIQRLQRAPYLKEPNFEIFPFLDSSRPFLQPRTMAIPNASMPKHVIDNGPMERRHQPTTDSTE